MHACKVVVTITAQLRGKETYFCGQIQNKRINLEFLFSLFHQTLISGTEWTSEAHFRLAAQDIVVLLLNINLQTS
jgi:hypothetical protein